MSIEDNLPILTAYYENDFGDPYSAFLTDDPKIVSRVDCEVVRAEDYILLKSERDSLRAELDKLKEQKPVAVVKNHQSLDSVNVTVQNVKLLRSVPDGANLYLDPVPPQQLPDNAELYCMEKGHRNYFARAGIKCSCKKYPASALLSPTPPSDEAK